MRRRPSRAWREYFPGLQRRNTRALPHRLEERRREGQASGGTGAGHRGQLMWLTSFALILSLALWAAGVTADTSSSADVVNPKTYGNCKVWIEVDMLTDEVLHALDMERRDLCGCPSVVIISGRGVLRTALSKGVMLHLGEIIPVAFRIEKGELGTGRWHWGSNMMCAVTG